MYQRLDEAVAELRVRPGGLPAPAEAEDIWSNIWHQEAHNSTALEGNTLVLQEVERLLDEGRAVGREAAQGLHGGARLRRRSTAGVTRDWVGETNKLRDIGDEPLPGALVRAHNSLEQIHPFLDGNGRAGRLALNLLLGRLGYPPAIIFKRDRDKYLQAMRCADRGEYGPLGELIARSVTANLYKFVIPAVAGPVKLVPLAALATSELSENALRVASMPGRLRAIKGDDGLRRSSKNWVDEYRQNRHRRVSDRSS
ncbi:Fic family protein [Saccharothrix sp. ALI-22-I]|uniref:Fic family protein n=1 Tax=Saccharothrix sp. ALI-22-I TaxID=1933778 RepID=UPI0019311288|nr:Fic family protein [Saccharothrix sp. ALI-22-I]